MRAAESGPGLRLRLNILLSLIFSAALAVAVLLLLNNARHAVTAELRASTDFASNLLLGLRAIGDGEAGRESFAALLARLDHHPPLRHLRISAAQGTPATGPDADDERAAVDAPRWFTRVVEPPPDFLTRKIGDAAGGIVIVADPGAEIAEAWREVRVTLWTLLAVFVGVNAAVYISLGRSLRPLWDLATALEGVEKGHYTARLAASGVADIDRLNERFNHMAEALERSERDHAALARRSLAIQEEERHYLARELHDEMGQSITAIKALAVSIRERADAVVGERAATIVEVSSAVYARIREMMTRLHPASLEELGLVKALEQMVDEWNSHHGECFCRLDLERRLAELPAEMRIGIYRIVQEGLTNVARHAAASEAGVVLRCDAGSGELHLSISDNGLGFDPASQPRGLGLTGIGERVQALGGRLRVRTAPGAGTHIDVALPLPSSASAEQAE